ncbi:MAG: hypothetical protein ACR2N6_03375 [Miltoncostaeaceae bacterium]
MNVIDGLTKQANRIADDVQSSLKRARIEGERRLLLRQHRAALESLGERTFELVSAGRLSGDLLDPEIAEVESKLMEIEAKVGEIEELRPDADDDDEDGAAPGDPTDAAFPMLSEDAPNGSDAGPGWDATKRFFAEDE